MTSNTIPYEIEYFVVYHKDTGQEYEFPEYWLAKSHCLFYNHDGDHTSDSYAPWEIYAKIK
jgi:hypothetical protein